MAGKCKHRYVFHVSEVRESGLYALLTIERNSMRCADCGARGRQKGETFIWDDAPAETPTALDGREVEKVVWDVLEETGCQMTLVGESDVEKGVGVLLTAVARTGREYVDKKHERMGRLAGLRAAAEQRTGTIYGT